MKLSFLETFKNRIEQFKCWSFQSQETQKPLPASGFPGNTYLSVHRAHPTALVTNSIIHTNKFWGQLHNKLTGDKVLLHCDTSLYRGLNKGGGDSLDGSYVHGMLGKSKGVANLFIKSS